MTVQLTPRGTRGAANRKLPSFAWRIVRVFMTLGNLLIGGKILELTTVGNKTGTERTVPLRYFPEGTDRWLLVASFAGAAKHPAWYVNRSKNPDKIWIKLGGEKFKVRGASLHGAERAKLWKDIVTVAPVYGGYETKTDREIPVVRLSRAR